ncbi:MAG: SDR family oxidoreductase [Saprospiraceae bacterium]|nr:SDR family oxidoreductase [Saprospiraceae bacterium]
MDITLTGKNALVCGSSRGIGKASAIVLSQQGANVTLVSRSEEKMKQVLSELDTSKGQTHSFLVVDFSDQTDLKNKVDDLTSQKPIHILVNNTGGPPGGPIINATSAAFLDAYHKHLVCNHILATSVIPGMEQSGYGRIINVISTSVKSPLNGLGVSNTTRGAVASWAKTLSNEIGGKGITVNNVLPGFTSTGRLDEIIENKSNKSGKSKEETIEAMKSIVPMKRFAAPSEIANAVGFLASPAASYITGINIPVDGGRTKCL